MYSQNNEEQIILNYFGDFIGSFVDIGSNDGITLSNTRALAERGWKGVSVEADPEAFKRLLKNNLFKGIYCYNWGMGEHNKVMPFWTMGNHLNKGDTGLLSTFDPEEKKRWPGVPFNETLVQVYTWAVSVNKFRLKKFDFINIDVEGGNLAVLKQIVSWKGFADVKCICVEWNGKDKEKFVNLCEGFKVIGTTPENLIFAR
jgi:FkbM family methyltransferase